MLRSIALALALVVGAPSLALAQQKAQVTCKDGSASKGGRGACSRHGGIAAQTPAMPAPAPTPAPMPRAPAPAPMPRTPTTPPSTPAAPTSRAPASPTAPGQPTARCKDGTPSYSLHHSGTCSHHGGVAQWLQ